MLFVQRSLDWILAFDKAKFPVILNYAQTSFIGPVENHRGDIAGIEALVDEIPDIHRRHSGRGRKLGDDN